MRQTSSLFLFPIPCVQADPRPLPLPSLMTKHFIKILAHTINATPIQNMGNLPEGGHKRAALARDPIANPPFLRYPCKQYQTNKGTGETGNGTRFDSDLLWGWKRQDHCSGGIGSARLGKREKSGVYPVPQKQRFRGTESSGTIGGPYDDGLPGPYQIYLCYDAGRTPAGTNTQLPPACLCLCQSRTS